MPTFFAPLDEKPPPALSHMAIPVVSQPARHEANSQFSLRGTAKLVQLRFWPTADHAFAGLLLKTLAAYHVGFVLTYLLSLYVVFLSKRGAEKLKKKVCDRSITEDDLRAWGGLPLSAVNLIASMRHYQSIISNLQLSPGPWYVDMVLSWLWL